MRITKHELKKIIILGVLGGAAPIILLYMSYNYISVGLAGTLHFVYPLITVIANAFIYHEKLRLSTLTAVVLVTIGIFMFADIGTYGESIGVILALVSGIFYSFFVIYIDRSGLDSMDYIKLTFYMMLIMSITTLIFGLAVHELSFSITQKAWRLAAVISFFITCLALPLFQAGVRYEGSSMAGILSAAEPVVSIAAGAVFLGEHIGALQLAGAAVIFLGLMMARGK
jgi:drug/metabolite transporter (DMT)-like permease